MTESGGYLPRNIVDAPSPNFGPRAEGKRIKYLILHYTGTRTAFDALRLLQGKDPAREVSAHYLVDESGEVMRLVDENARAWHAGKSFWEGERDINSCSIGIEIHNPGYEHGYRPFPADQVLAVKQLCEEIVRRHGILPCHVLAHSDIAPERKKDPGELFPWREAALGDWPQAGGGVEGEEGIEALLTRYGYDPEASLESRITAFQRHFEPEVFAAPERIGTASPETVRRLRVLLQQKFAFLRAGA